MPIYFDKQSGAYTDGKRFVKAALIRKYAKEKMGKPQLRGRLKSSDIESFWLDSYGEAIHYEA